jgi:WD40 repeat protein
MSAKSWSAAALVLCVRLARSPAAPRDQSVRGQPARDLHGDPLPAGAVARLGTFRLRNLGGAFAVAFSPDGARLAWGGADSRVGVLNLATGALEADFSPGSANHHIACSADGTHVASASEDGTILIWDLRAAMGVGLSKPD